MWVGKKLVPYGLSEMAEVITLRKRHPTVHRLRKSDKSIECVKDKNGEYLWVVGNDTMPESEMKAMARV
jgi:hypothetical protein